MRMKAPEYVLTSIIVLVVAYLVVTPLAHRTANLLNEDAALIEKYSQFN